MAVKTPQEKGFTIPVKRKIGLGRYQKGWAKSLEPVKGKIQICFDSGRRSSWADEVTEHEPRGFDPLSIDEPPIMGDFDKDGNTI